MLPRTVFLLMLILGLTIGSVLAIAQPKWQPAVIFSRALGQVTYLPGLGEKGYVHCWRGPDGVRYGIYDLKTLSDTSKFICELPGEVSNRRIGSAFDANKNGIPDVLMEGMVQLDVCTPIRKDVLLAPEVAFYAGQADIDGNGRPEYLAHYTVPNLITLNDSGTTFWKWRLIPTVPRAVDLGGVLHLGTLGGKPRFLTVSRHGDGSRQYKRFALETLEPSQLNSANDTLTLTTLHVYDSFISTDVFAERLFTFPDVWYLPMRDSMLVITADTIVSVKKDPTMGTMTNHLGQKQEDPTRFQVIDATQFELVGGANPTPLTYVRLRTEGTRLWAEEIARITTDTTMSGLSEYPDESTIVGDVDSDGMPDFIVGGWSKEGTRSFLYLTTGRVLSSVLSGSMKPVLVPKMADGWTVSVADCRAMRSTRAAVYDISGALIAMADVVPIGDSMWRIPSIPLPAGAAFAVLESCVVRLQ